MKRKVNITIAGKEYEAERLFGKVYIDGKPLDEFMETLDPLALIDCANIGIMAVNDEIRGTKPRKYQSTMNAFTKMRN